MYNNGHIPHFIHTNTQTRRAQRVITFYYLQKQTCYKMQNTCICNFCLHMHSPDAGCHNIYIYTNKFVHWGVWDEDINKKIHTVTTGFQ